MPHLTALQADYRKKGLTVIGVTAKDENTSAGAVEAFVAKRGKHNAYTFAYCDDRETYDAYMTAAGLDGIPTAFVVGPTGKVEFIGHALELDLIIPRVMSGTWRGQLDIDEVRKEFGRFNEIMNKGQTDPAAALKEYAVFESEQPKLVAGYFYRIMKLQLLLLGKRYEDARTLAASLIQYGVDSQDAFLLNGIRVIWSLPPWNPEKKHPELALKAAESELMVEGDRDPAALYHVAEAYAFAGDTAKTGEYGRKAIAAAEGADRKKYEAGLKKLLDSKPDR